MKGKESVRAKLDRCFGNSAFTTVVPIGRVLTLPVHTSDHHVLQLLLLPKNQPCSSRRFSRLEPWWFKHPEAGALVEEHWNMLAQPPPKTILRALNNMKTSLHTWSLRTFGVIPNELGKLRHKLIALEREGGPNDHIQVFYRKLQELTEVENDYWQQRSRSNWLQGGN